MNILDKIKELEEEIRRTQKNKATEHHLGILKAKIAKLRRQFLSLPKNSVGKSFDVKKTGDASVALIGFPSVGKSTFLNKITNASSKTAHYAFTTLTCIPGMLNYKGANIQILDLPGIIEGAKDGKGRGREVISVARNSDLILIMLDAQHLEHYEIIIKELYGIGIRINSKPPDVTITKRERGPLSISSTVELTKLSHREISAVLHEYGIHSGEVVFREDIDVDQLIDVLENNRVYLPAIVVINKIDLVSEEEIRKKFPYDFIAISAERGINLDQVKEAIYNKLNFIRIFTKKRNEDVDFSEPLIVRKGATVADVCKKLHKDFFENFKYAIISGKSVKHKNQRVGLDHVLEDGDIVTIVTK